MRVSTEVLGREKLEAGGIGGDDNTSHQVGNGGDRRLMMDPYSSRNKEGGTGVSRGRNLLRGLGSWPQGRGIIHLRVAGHPGGGKNSLNRRAEP